MIQEILDIITKEGFKFPFKEKDWANKFGVYCLLSLIPTVIIISATFIAIIPFLGIVALAFLIILLPIIFVTSIYLQGYLLEIIRRVMKKEKEEIPKHDDIRKTFKLGLIRFAIEFPPTFLGVILVLLSVTLIFGGIFFLAQGITIAGIILMTLGITLTTITTLLTLLIVTIVLPSMLYIYLKTNSIRTAYCFQNISNTVRIAWKEFLVIWGITLIGSTLISVLTQMPCIGLLAMVAGYAYMAFVVAFVMGKIYSNIDTRTKIKLK